MRRERLLVTLVAVTALSTTTIRSAHAEVLVTPDCSVVTHVQAGCTPVVAVGGNVVGVNNLGDGEVSPCQSTAAIAPNGGGFTIMPPGAELDLIVRGDSICVNTDVTVINHIGIFLYLNGTSLLTTNTCTNPSPGSSTFSCTGTAQNVNLAPGDTLKLVTSHNWDLTSGSAWLFSSQPDGCDIITTTRMRCYAISTQTVPSS